MWQDLPSRPLGSTLACWKQANTRGSESLRARPPLYTTHCRPVPSGHWHWAPTFCLGYLWQQPEPSPRTPWPSLALLAQGDSVPVRGTAMCFPLRSVPVESSVPSCRRGVWSELQLIAIYSSPSFVPRSALSLLYHLHSQYYMEALFWEHGHSYTMCCNVIAIVCMEQHT